jgi:Transposase
LGSKRPVDDLDRRPGPGPPGGIIGLAPGCSGACVVAWMSFQSKEFRDGVAVVAIDPSAPYASGIRRALPQAKIVLDPFHLVMLANKMLTDVRQRVQHKQQGRRGMKVDPAWANGYSRHETSTRRIRFLQACIDADMPEATRLAGTIEKWWPEIEGFLRPGKTNECASQFAGRGSSPRKRHASRRRPSEASSRPRT